MTTDQANQITMMVERTTTTRKRDDAARKHVVLSYFVLGNELLTGMLESGIGNPFVVTFQNVQATLPQNKLPETETITTSVDGQDAKVTRTKRGKVPNDTATKLAALKTAADSPHVFESQPEDEFCRRCGHPADGAPHQNVPTYRERVAYWQNHEGGVEGQEMGENMAASVAADDALAGDCLAMTDEDKAWYDQLNGDFEPVSDAAAKLIADAALTPALAE